MNIPECDIKEYVKQEEIENDEEESNDGPVVCSIEDALKKEDEMELARFEQQKYCEAPILQAST